MNIYDAVIVLGGGRNKDGTLTNLAQRRLDSGSEYVSSGRARYIVVMGGRYKPLTPDKGLHDVDGFELRRQYLIAKGVANEKIVTIKDQECQDTIYEAFASRGEVRNRNWKRIVLSTSIRHVDRALMIFKTIYGPGVEVAAVNNPCVDDLSETLEASMTKMTKPFLEHVANYELEPKGWDEWYLGHLSFYDYLQKLVDEMRTRNGVVSQAHAMIWNENTGK